MRPVSLLTLSAALGSIAVLPACAGSSPGSTSLFPSSSVSAGSPLHSRKRGSPLGTCTDERRLQVRMAHRQFAKPAANPPYLYVADSCEPSIDVLNGKTYYELGSITDRVSGPTDVFVDSKGNLYVANADSGNVTEYAPGDWSAPSFTYSVNMQAPFAVTADAHGDVYEGDYNGYINEYYQKQNAETVVSCQPAAPGEFGLPNPVVGVAVDSSNDVFAMVDASSVYLVEYPGGLDNCPPPKVLPLGGENIAVDKNANLLIANGTSVEVVDEPSYSEINATIGSGFSCAGNVRLNKGNTLAFVTDTCNDTVTVVNYPSGTNATVLGTGNGLSEPVAAVPAPNAVY